MKSCVVMQWSQCRSLNLIWFTTTLSYNTECLPVAAIQLSINLNHYCSVIYKLTCIIILIIIFKITVLESEVKSELLETITSPFKTLQLFSEWNDIWRFILHIAQACTVSRELYATRIFFKSFWRHYIYYCSFCCCLGDHTYSIGILILDSLCVHENNLLQQTICSRNMKHPICNKSLLPLICFQRNLKRFNS